MLSTILAAVSQCLKRLIDLVAILGDLRRHIDLRFDDIEASQARDHEILEAIRFVVIGGPPARLIFTVQIGEQILEGVTSMIITVTQKFSISVQPVDAKGNPAVVDGAATFESSNPAAIEVTPTGDLTADVRAVGVVGSGQVSVSVDADLGEGVRTISGVLDVEVQPGEAVALTINTGPVEEQ
jgi:hypothetical protein